MAALSGVFTITNAEFHNRASCVVDHDQEPVACNIPADLTTVTLGEQWEITPSFGGRYSVRNVQFRSYVTTYPRPTEAAPVFASGVQSWWLITEMDPGTYGPDVYSILCRDHSDLCWGLRDGDNATPIQLCPFSTDGRNLWKIIPYPPIVKKPFPFKKEKVSITLHSAEHSPEHEHIDVQIEWKGLPVDSILQFPEPLSVLYHGDLIAEAVADDELKTNTGILGLTLRAKDTPAFSSFASSILRDDDIQVSLEAHKFRFYPRNISERPSDWEYIYQMPLKKDMTFKGLHSFRERVKLRDFKIKSSSIDSQGDYIDATIITTIDNASRLSCTANIAVGVYYGKSKVLFNLDAITSVRSDISLYIQIGTAEYSNFKLEPASSNERELKWQFRPLNPANFEVQMLLDQHFTTTQLLPVELSVESISAIICGKLFNLPRFTVNARIQGLGVKLVRHVDVHLGAFGLLQRKVAFTFEFENPVETNLEICYIELDVIVKGVRVANVKHKFDRHSKSRFTIGPREYLRSPKISDAYLVTSYAKTLQLVSDKSATLDVEVKSANIKVDKYLLQGLTYNLKEVPFSIHLT